MDLMDCPYSHIVIIYIIYVTHIQLTCYIYNLHTLYTSHEILEQVLKMRHYKHLNGCGLCMPSHFAALLLSLRMRLIQKLKITIAFKFVLLETLKY